MSHNDLIKSLTQNLEPVEKSPCYHVRAFQFVLLSYLFIFVVAVFIGFRDDIDLLFSNVEVLGQVIALLIAGLFSVVATFRLTTPSEKIGRVNGALIGGAVALLLGVTLYCAGGANMEDFDLYMNWETVSHRLRNFILLAIVPTGLMIWMIKKGKPVHMSLVGFTSFLAITCISVTGCRMLCPVDSLLANLIWHYLPIITLSFLGYLIGRYLYRW